MLKRAFLWFLLLLPSFARGWSLPAFYTVAKQYRFAKSDPRCSNPSQPLCSSNPQHGLGDRDYSLNFVEFDDKGKMFDSTQLDAAVDQLRDARKNDGQTIVFIYIHGWHNNAEERTQTHKSPSCQDNTFTGDVKKFEECGLKVLAASYPPSSFGAPPRIVGIYLAWHGTDFGWPPFSYVPSYPLRRRAARNVGLEGMASALRCIYSVIEEARPSYYVVAMGHSFGARVLEAADEIHDDRHPDAGIFQSLRKTSRASAKTEQLLPVDLIFYVNAASSNSISRLTIADWEERCASGNPPLECVKDPLYLAVSSRADILTAVVMPIANVVFFAPWTDQYHIISAANTPSLQTHSIPRRLNSEQPPGSLSGSAFCFDVPALPQDIYYRVDPKPARTPAVFWDMNTDHWSASLAGVLHGIPGLRQLIRPNWIISSHGDVWNTGVFNMVRAVVERDRAKLLSQQTPCKQNVEYQKLRLKR